MPMMSAGRRGCAGQGPFGQGARLDRGEGVEGRAPLGSRANAIFTYMRPTGPRAGLEQALETAF